jgi:hypothetical protein
MPCGGTGRHKHLDHHAVHYVLLLVGFRRRSSPYVLQYGVLNAIKAFRYAHVVGLDAESSRWCSSDTLQPEYRAIGHRRLFSCSQVMNALLWCALRPATGNRRQASGVQGLIMHVSCWPRHRAMICRTTLHKTSIQCLYLFPSAL